MSLRKEIFFCLNCNASAFSREKIIHEKCDVPSYIMEAEVIFKRSHTCFWSWFFSLDIAYGLAFMGASIVNIILLKHLGLTGMEALEVLLESFCFGLALILLLK